MAQAKFRTLYTSTTGLNNFVDPTRLEFDFKTGVTELAQAINVNIDNSGRINCRRGRVQKLSSTAKYGFAYGEVCLFVSESILYHMKSDYSVTALRSDLTLGARMRYVGIANRVYYSNGTEKGYILKGKDYTWEKGNYTVPGDTRRIISDPPNGHLLGWFASRALVAVDNAIFASEPSFYGVFDLHNNFKLFPERIKLMHPTTQGLWIGTASQVLFYRGTKWGQLRREPKADYGVLEGSGAVCPGEKLNAPEKSVIFTTPQGICVGDEGGGFTNLTYNKLIFPTGRYASASIVGDRYLVLIEP